jgi:hypothetical protein
MAVFEAVQAGTTITISPVILTAGGMAVAVAVSWGVMKTTIAHITREIQNVRHDLRNFQTAQNAMMIEALERVARIEGSLSK